MDDLVIFYPEGHQGHFENGHPERPERIEVVRRAMEYAGWWERFPKIPPLNLSVEFLESVHERSYLAALKAACNQGAHLDLDTYTTQTSWQLALNAAGGAAGLAEMVWKGDPAGGKKPHGFALSRPPGHHAERMRGMGFCLLNNIAVAAEHLISGPINGAPNATRLGIIDIDLHHGNGTQDIFYQRDDVLFISTHQSPLYPGTGAVTEIGAGAGRGYTINLPFPPGTGDAGYLAAMSEIILPALDRFKPEMLLVSLGFDPHWRDPLGHLLLTVSGYGNLVKKMRDWADDNCQSKIACVMEGGYDNLSVAGCALAACAALLGEPIVDSIGPSPRPEGKSWQAMLTQVKTICQL